MAIIHRAQLTPSKLELVQEWLPTRSWFRGDVSALTLLGSYRFDDPAGEVGLETLLVGGDGLVIQVPLTFRGVPLAGAESWLMGTLEHTVLGRRWAYHACGDPVFAAGLATTMITGGRQARLMVQTDTGEEEREATTLVIGSGSPNTAVPPIDAIDAASDDGDVVIRAGGLELVIRQVLEANPSHPAATSVAGELRGTWPGQTEPALLAYVR